MKKLNGMISSTKAKKETSDLKRKKFRCEDCGREKMLSNVTFGKNYNCSECGGTLCELIK